MEKVCVHLAQQQWELLFSSRKLQWEHIVQEDLSYVPKGQAGST